MEICARDVVEGLRQAREHARSRSVLISAGDDWHLVSCVGLLVNSRPPEEASEPVAHAFQIALEHARACEVEAAGSALACLAYAEHALLDPGSCLPTALEGRSFVRRDVSALVAGILPSDEREAAAGFVERAGAARYLVEREEARRDSVELVDRYEFDHASRAVEGRVSMDGARVLVADAYVESASEVHRLLDACGASKERLLLCCRGFCDDVLHTLAVNRQRGTLAAYALAFPFDLENANTLVDVATVAGTDVVSSLKGQLLSTVDPAVLPIVSKAWLRGTALAIEDRSAAARVERLRAGLVGKLEDAPEAARDPLERRLRRLSGVSMIVRLASGVDHGARCERWDLALRSVRAATRGVVVPSDREAWPERELVPLLSEAAARTYAGKLVRRLGSLARLV